MTIEWNNDFVTNEPTIDEQHRRLFDFINNLERILETQGYNEPGRIDRLIAWVDDYIVDHFAYEEDCMLSHNCDVAERNHKAHENFLKFFGTFKDDYHEQGFREELLANLHRTTEGWIANHIMKIDLNLRACL